MYVAKSSKYPLLCVKSVSKEYVNNAHVSSNSEGTSAIGGVNTTDVSVNTEGIHTIDVSDTVHMPDQ